MKGKLKNIEQPDKTHGADGQGPGSEHVCSAHVSEHGCPAAVPGEDVRPEVRVQRTACAEDGVCEQERRLCGRQPWSAPGGAVCC